MNHILTMTDELKLKILDFLYEDELFNIFLIHFIENQIDDIGELYIAESGDRIISVLHMKFDGFTSQELLMEGLILCHKKNYCNL